MQMIEALDHGVHAFMPTGLHAVCVSIYSLRLRSLKAKLFSAWPRVPVGDNR